VETLAVAIIGTAGRTKKNPVVRWSLAMDTARRLCRKLRDGGKRELKLISGGAPWGDSLAVRLFLENEAEFLRLNLPAAFSSGDRRFMEYGDRYSAGAILNRYHDKALGAGCPYDSLEDLALVLDGSWHGCSFTVHDTPKIFRTAFRDRNIKIANEASGMLCVHFGAGKGLPKGGTRQTAEIFLRRGVKDKVTVFDLDTGEVYLWGGLLLERLPLKGMSS